MIKQCAIVAMMAITLLTGAMVWAAREEHTFEVSLTVPNRSFYLLPTEPGWIHQAQQLEWDYPTSTLGSLRKSFDVRHDTSAIEARMETSPYLSNGKPAGIIELWVRFNGVTLIGGMPAREVVSAEDATVGKRVWLEITPLKPIHGYQPGDYSGNVLLVFNAKAPGA
ncbi:CS1 type fimbrial major subunit [Pseudomonas sp. TMB3-21]